MRRIVGVLLVVLLTVAARPQVAAQSDSSTVPTSVVVATAPTSAVEVGDPESTRRINRLIVALLGLAVLFAAITVWFWRVTRPVGAHLEGLEIMGHRRLRAGRLDRLRRARGTPPKLDIVEAEAVVAEPVVAPAAAPSAIELVTASELESELLHVADDDRSVDNVHTHE